MVRKGERHTEEAKKKISEAHKGKTLSENHRARFLEGRRKYVEEFIRIHGHHPNKGSHVNKGRRPVKTFQKGNTIWLGRHHTEATRQKLSAAFRGKPGHPQTAETRKNMSASHIGQIPWNRGLTKDTSQSVALIGQKKSAWWTPERKRQHATRSSEFMIEWWKKHPEAKEKNMQTVRPTRIEQLARASLVRRRIPFQVNKQVDGFCFPDLVLSDSKIAVFCNGCYWHACPQHNPIVPDWLRSKIKDEFVNRELEKRGWKVLVIWEHEFKTNKDIVGEKLDLMLGSSPEVSE